MSCFDLVKSWLYVMQAVAIVQQSFSTNLCLFLFTTEEWTLRCQKPIDLYITKAKRRFKKLLLRSICYRQQYFGYIWLCWRLFKKNCWNEVCTIPNAFQLFLIFASFTLLSQKRKKTIGIFKSSKRIVAFEHRSGLQSLLIFWQSMKKKPSTRTKTTQV